MKLNMVYLVTTNKVMWLVRWAVCTLGWWQVRQDVEMGI